MRTFTNNTKDPKVIAKHKFSGYQYCCEISPHLSVRLHLSSSTSPYNLSFKGDMDPGCVYSDLTMHQSGKRIKIVREPRHLYPIINLGNILRIVQYVTRKICPYESRLHNLYIVPFAYPKTV